MSDQKEIHWLCRPKTIRGLWGGAIALLLVLLGLELTLHSKGYFGIDGTFGFYAWFGFICSVGMIALSKVIGIFIKRKDTYYD